MAVDDVRDGRAEPSLGERFARTRPHLRRAARRRHPRRIGIAVGLVLLIAPGLFLLTLWVLIVPAIVLENRSRSESFGR